MLFQLKILPLEDVSVGTWIHRINVFGGSKIKYDHDSRFNMFRCDSSMVNGTTSTINCAGFDTLRKNCDFHTSISRFIYNLILTGHYIGEQKMIEIFNRYSLHQSIVC
jgi:hypothetical protein